MLWKGLVFLGVLHLFYQLFVLVPIMLDRVDPYRDVIVYYKAAVRLRDGVNVYQPWPGYGVQMTPFRFFYSPPFLLLVRPLAGLDFLTFTRVWTLILLVPFWSYCFCLSRLARGKWDWQSALVFGMATNIALKGYATLALGQFEPFMWMLFGLALTTRHRAGWLALATLTKIHPVWSLGLTLAEGGKREWKNAALFAVPVLLASWWLVGSDNWAMWWPSTQPVASQGTFSIDNWSLPFFGLRLLNWAGLLKASGTLPPWAKGYLSLCAVVGPLGVMFWARKWSRELRLAFVACAGALFAPLCWTLYFPLFLLPVAVLIGERRGRDEAMGTTENLRTERA
ncbi:hypothetical protein IAD21_02666 [Abditibacteriota bacterium]|nr:hypothetical protein IAD21_02666 [Abditibacteriota bacterium]